MLIEKTRFALCKRLFAAFFVTKKTIAINRLFFPPAIDRFYAMVTANQKAAVPVTRQTVGIACHK